MEKDFSNHAVAAPAADTSARAGAVGRSLLLYDGVCALCNHSVQFLLARDRKDQFRFASLQSGLGRALVEQHGRNPDDLDTVILIDRYGTPEERVYVRSRAVLIAAARLGGPYALLHVFRLLPAFVLDLGYRLVARLRYRIFGKYDACRLPSPEERSRFLDVEAPERNADT